MAKEKPVRITDEEVAQLCHAITIACGEMIGQVERHEIALAEHALNLNTLGELWDSDKKGVDAVAKVGLLLNDRVNYLHERLDWIMASQSGSYDHAIDNLWAELQAMQTPWYVKRWRQLANLVKPPESF